MTEQTWVIINPTAARGRAGRTLARRCKQIERVLGPCEIRQTAYQFHAAELAREAIDSGATRIVAVGGDGTISEVVNGLCENGRSLAPDIRLGLIPLGTGGDFRRSMALPGTIDSQLAVIQADHRQSVDVGFLAFSGHDGTPQRRHFINIASCGMSGVVCESVNSMRLAKRFGGKIAFNLASLKAMLTYANQPVRITIDDEHTVETIINTLAICNGRFFGGGMQIAPMANPSDARFDVVALGDLNMIDTLRSMPSLYAGTHLTHPKVQSWQARRIHVEPLDDTPLRLEVDGEAPGCGPVTFEVCPGVLSMLMPEPPDET